MTTGWIRAVVVVGLVAWVAGCGGGGGDGSGGEPAPVTGTATIDAAGGTVTGSDGASVTVPAGVLKEQSTVTVAIAKNAAEAPTSPPSESFIPVSNVFTITPHGHGFAEPVQVTLPFDASLVRDTDQLVVLKAQPFGNWVAHSDVTRQGSMATLAVRDFSVFMVAVRTAIRLPPPPTTPAPVPAPVPFSFTLAVSGTSPNLTITYTFSGTRPTCIGGDRLETVFMTKNDWAYHDIVGISRNDITYTELLGVTVPNFSAPAPALIGTSLLHTVIQPAHMQGFQAISGAAFVDPFVKGRYICNGERTATNTVSAPWTLESANAPALPYNGAGVALREDMADFQTSVGTTVVSRARAQTLSPNNLPTESKWEVSRDNGATWSVHKLGAERVTPDTSFYGDAAARVAGVWAIEGDLPAFAGTDNGARLRFSACTYVPPNRHDTPWSLQCATGAEHILSVAFVALAPSFTAMPAPMAVVAGAGASFSVVAAGLPTPTLQWQRRAPQGTWQDIPGAQGPTYNLSATTLTQDGSQYQVVATNTSGSVTSALATLNVVDQAAPPAISAVSGPLTVVEGGSAVFAATVSGTAPLSFQWRRNGVDILGANTPILRLDGVASAQAGSYVLQVGNPAGNVQSTAQQLTVAPAGAALPTAPSIVTQPVSVLVNAGNTATFAVGASGSGPLAYQWRRNNLDIPGATDAFYSIASVALSDAATYAVVVSNGAGSASSFNVILTVNAAAPLQAPTITTQPGSIVVAPGMSVALGVGVQGSGPIGYQWLRNGTVLPGETQATLTIGAVTSFDAGSYQVQVSNAVGGPVTSTAAQVILLGAPAIANQPANTSASEGNTTTFNVGATGSALRYQWTRNNVGISGATSASYTTPALTLADSGTVYGVIVYNGAGLVFSQGAVLTVNPAVIAPTVTQQPVNVTVDAGLPANICGAFGGTPPLALQLARWDGTQWVTVASISTSSTSPVCVSTPNLQLADNGAQFRFFATNASAFGVMTDVVTVTVTPAPTGRLALVTNYLSNSLSILRADPTTGALTSLGSVPTGANPFAVAVSPNGLYAYVGNLFGGSISAYAIDRTGGTLAPIPGGSRVSNNPYGIAVDPLGRFLWVANYGFNTVSAFAIGPNGALAAAGAPLATGALPRTVAVHPNGNFVYVAAEAAHSIAVYAVDAGTGALTLRPGTVANSVLSPSAMAMHPNGNLAYVSDAGSGAVAAFNINASTGLLSVKGYYSSGSGTNAVAIHPGGQFLYVSSSNGVTLFAIDATGSLAAVGAATPAGTVPQGLALDGAGTHLYVTDLSGGTVSAFAIDAGTGALSPLGAALATGGQPSGVALTP
jgi:6-phosphogluconolactonase (cycloisomerase 2 family)